MPPRIQKGFDRRRISATVLLAESTISKSKGDNLRALVFERLNTGGEKLVPQEIRNSIYASPFNDLIVKLAGNRLFNEIWGIPPYEDNIRGEFFSKQLMNNAYFKRMRDCEIVLRFFTFRQKSLIKGSVVKMLDNCMRLAQKYDEGKSSDLGDLFISRLTVAHEIFGEFTFRIKHPKSALSIPLYDAIMVAVDRLFEHRNLLINNRKKIERRLQAELKDEATYELIIARANTASAVKQRLAFVEEIFRECVD